MKLQLSLRNSKHSWSIHYTCCYHQRRYYILNIEWLVKPREVDPECLVQILVSILRNPTACVVLSMRTVPMSIYGHCSSDLRPTLLSDPVREEEKWAFVCQQLSSTMEQGKYKEINLFWPLIPTLWLALRSVHLCGLRYTKLGFAGNTEPQFIIPSCEHRAGM